MSRRSDLTVDMSSRCGIEPPGNLPLACRVWLGTPVARDAEGVDIKRQPDGRLLSSEASTLGWTLDIVPGTDNPANVTAKDAFAIAERTVHVCCVHVGVSWCARFGVRCQRGAEMP
jgi:hypothetical protein